MKSSLMVYRGAVIAMSLVLCGGCALHRPLDERQIGELGRMGFRRPVKNLDGVVIGVPRASSEPAAAEYGRFISDATGAGLAMAYGFAAHRVTVTQPLVYTSPIVARIGDVGRPGSIYSEFRATLHNAANGPLKLYIGVRVAGDESKIDRIEVASSGLSFEQLKVLKAAFSRIRDRKLNRSKVPKVDLALSPLDDISWNTTGVKNHGVLMLAEKGLILRLPKILAGEVAKDTYVKIITEWVSEALTLATLNPTHLPEIRVEAVPLGRIDSISSRSKTRGIVIAAPHGSFDRHTGDLVQELSYRTGLAAVITRGFTPTEAGGWRINVNRPTERRYPANESERGTERSETVYRRFAKAVVRAAGGPIDLYLDIHQSASPDHIDVATVGISAAEARAIGTAYETFRDSVLSRQADAPRVNLLIEPLDKVTFTALGAKKHGILRAAKRGLHIELPAHQILYRPSVRRAYTEILADWIAYMGAATFGLTSTRTVDRSFSVSPIEPLKASPPAEVAPAHR